MRDLFARWSHGDLGQLRQHSTGLERYAFCYRPKNISLITSTVVITLRVMASSGRNALAGITRSVMTTSGRVVLGIVRGSVEDTSILSRG